MNKITIQKSQPIKSVTTYVLQLYDFNTFNNKALNFRSHIEKGFAFGLLRAIIILFFFIHLGVMHAAVEKEFWLIRPYNPKGHGFFSSFNLVLGHIYLYEAKSFKNVTGMKIDFGNEGNYYSPDYGYNWWEYYFEPLTFGDNVGAKVIPSPHLANLKAWSARRSLSRKEANRILHSNVKIKPFVLDFVDEFISKQFGLFTIGVHYRGTDKISEAPRVDYDDVISEIANQVSLLESNDYKIFVATDEQSFLDYIEKIFPSKVISTESTRSNSTSNVHSNSLIPYKIGLEALVDAILLSKCNLLIRTSSSLSLWSTYYNLNLPVIRLNDRYEFQNE